MLKVNFQIDPYYVASCAITKRISSDGEKTFIRGEEPRKQLRAFREIFLKRDPVTCDFLKNADAFFNVMVAANHYGISSAELGRRAEDLLIEAVQMDDFKPILAETQKALNDLQSEWLKNFDKSSAAVHEITGITFNKTIDLYVTHPCQAEGHNSAGTIYFTYRIDFPFYNTVYIWHEILHSYIRPEQQGNDRAADETSHAIIELISDNELRVRLGGGSYPPFEGHRELTPVREALLPSWKDYLAQQGKCDIYDYYTMAIKLDRERRSEKTSGALAK